MNLIKVEMWHLLLAVIFSIFAVVLKQLIV
jgi:hypothetical protein